MDIGSFQHKQSFCHAFWRRAASDAPPFPNLDDATRQKLQSTSFWPRLYHDARQATQVARAYAESLDDKMFREAIARFAQIKEQQAQSIQQAAQRCGVSLGEGSGKATTFAAVGYRDYQSLFLGSGFFRLAQQRDYLPEAVLDVWQHWLAEETQLVQFWANWLAYTKARSFSPKLEQATVQATGVLLTTLLRLSFAFSTVDEEDRATLPLNTTADLLGVFTFRYFLTQCIEAQRFDSTTAVTPQMGPQVAERLLGVLKFWPEDA